MTKNKSRKLIWFVGGALVLLLVGYLGIGRLQRLRATLAQPGTGEIVTAFVGDLSAGATASGQVAAGRDAGLTLSTSGTIGEIYVRPGDTVAAGDPLLALETGELARAVESAQEAVTLQEANLASLIAPPSAGDLAAAQAAVASAQANLAELAAGPTDDEIAAAEARLAAANADLAAAQVRLRTTTGGSDADEIRAAEIELQLAQQEATRAAERHRTILVTEPQGPLTEERLAEIEFSARTAAVQANARLAAAQEALDSLLNGDPNAVASAQVTVAVAQVQRDSVQAQLDLLLEGPSEAQLASAEASLAQAEASLDRLERGPSAVQIERAEIAVEQARLNLRRAERDVGEATLRAPFSGVIIAVHAAEGEIAGGILVELVDTSSLEVALEVDEVDIGAIRIGEAAVVTLEAWPDVELEGQVASIAPRASRGNSAVVSYRVTLSFDPEDLPVRVGMTANAGLTVASLENVLLLPNRAINVDRTAGVYRVNLVQADADGRQSVEEVQVGIGLRDGDLTQITAGLAAGDQVLVGDPSALITFGPGQRGRGGPFGNR